MSGKQYDCVVIGSGPGGYVAAIRAAQLGLKTACIEKESPGGVCLNWGCIPSKALLKSAEMYTHMQHAESYGLKAKDVSFDFGEVMGRSREVVGKMTKGVSFLLKKNKVDYIEGTASFNSKNSLLVKGKKEEVVNFKNVIIATGGRARTVPSLPVDEERILTYRYALDLKKQPKKLLIIGAGAIGIEFGYFFSSMGTDVTIVEMLPSILPQEDHEVSKTLQNIFKKKGVNVLTETGVEKLARKGNKVEATLDNKGKKTEWSGDHAIVAIGFQGNVEGLNLDILGITPEKSFIEVDEFYRTGVPGIYAIGDITGAPLLAHVASHEGVIAAEHIAGENTHPLDYGCIPAGTYCQPQVGSVGLTEKAAKEAGYDISVGKFPFSASGKAVAINETEGFVKVVVDKNIGEILGVHILHAEATELISEATIAKSHEGIASSVLNTIHAHPTLSEAVMEAMGAALGKPIHI